MVLATMDERIKEHLKRLNMYHQRLRNAQDASYEVFVSDDVLLSSSERYLHLAIESCINVGNRLLSLYQFQKPVRSPETYADIFRELRLLGVVDAAFRDRLIQMAKFRNRLVHLYWELESEQVYRFIQEDLGDFRGFQDDVVNFLNANPISDPST